MMNCWCDQCVTRRVMLQTKVSPGILLLTELLVPLTNVFSNSFFEVCSATLAGGVNCLRAKPTSVHEIPHWVPPPTSCLPATRHHPDPPHETRRPEGRGSGCTVACCYSLFYFLAKCLYVCDAWWRRLAQEWELCLAGRLKTVH